MWKKKAKGRFLLILAASLCLAAGASLTGCASGKDRNASGEASLEAGEESQEPSFDMGEIWGEPILDSEALENLRAEEARQEAEDDAAVVPEAGTSGASEDAAATEEGTQESGSGEISSDVPDPGYLEWEDTEPIAEAEMAGKPENGQAVPEDQTASESSQAVSEGQGVSGSSQAASEDQTASENGQAVPEDQATSENGNGFLVVIDAGHQSCKLTNSMQK